MRTKAGPLALVVVAAVVVTSLVVGRAVLRDDSPCGALAERVVGLDGYRWDNGVTSSGSEWLSVLTDGTTEADGPSRQQIAVAVRSDPEGYDRFQAALPDDLRPVTARQHTIALDPDSDRADPALERDARALARYGAITCNLV